MEFIISGSNGRIYVSFRRDLATNGGHEIQSEFVREVEVEMYVFASRLVMVYRDRHGSLVVSDGGKNYCCPACKPNSQADADIH